jgi:hypothetical protein
MPIQELLAYPFKSRVMQKYIIKLKAKTSPFPEIRSGEIIQID